MAADFLHMCRLWFRVSAHRLTDKDKDAFMAIASGTIPGRYEIRAKIGAAGMGAVYFAPDTDCS